MSDVINVTDIVRGDVVESSNGTRITVSDVMHQRNMLTVITHHDDRGCQRWSTVDSRGALFLVGKVDPDTLPPLPAEFTTRFGVFHVTWDMDGMDDVPVPGPMLGWVSRQSLHSSTTIGCGQVWAADTDDEWHGRYQQWLTDDRWPVVSGSLEHVVTAISATTDEQEPQP